jgi:hypothetical protein
MELNNKEDVDPLVIETTNVETKINEIQGKIVKELRPILVQLNEEGEPSLTNTQDRSTINIYHKLNEINYKIKMVFFS